jgi:hypothetical protein
VGLVKVKELVNAAEADEKLKNAGMSKKDWEDLIAQLNVQLLREQDPKEQERLKATLAEAEKTTVAARLVKAGGGTRRGRGKEEQCRRMSQGRWNCGFAARRDARTCRCRATTAGSTIP